MSGVILAAGALGNCNVPTLVLLRKGPDSVDFNLPSDEVVTQAFQNRRVDLCEHSYLYDRAFAERASDIIVTAGDLLRPPEELGSVDFGRTGGDWINWTTIAIGRNFAHTRVTRRFLKATPKEINELLRRRALFLYGTKVDAVINVAYQGNPRNDVFATGLAVRFTGEAAARNPRGGVESGLEELKRLLDKGLITEPEYRQRREEVLRPL